MVDRIQRGELFKQRHLEIKNITSEDDGDTATATVNDSQHQKQTKQLPIRVLMSTSVTELGPSMAIPDHESTL